VQLHDQLKALEMVARRLGMFNDKLTLKGDSNNPLAILIKEFQGNSFKPVH
jgi:phage terminase small subunit